MKLRPLITAALLAAGSAGATDVGVSVSVGDSGFYGRIDVGTMPKPPPVVYTQPVVVETAPVVVERPPIYLRVPASLWCSVGTWGGATPSTTPLPPSPWPTRTRMSATTRRSPGR